MKKETELTPLNIHVFNTTQEENQEEGNLIDQDEAYDLEADVYDKRSRELSAVEVMDELPYITRANSCVIIPTSPATLSNSSSYKIEKSVQHTVDVEVDPDACEEFWRLISLAYPVVITYVLANLPGLVCITLVGHMDSPMTKQYVDAATLSNMFTNISALSVGYGLASALDTLCSQAFGAGKPLKLGIYLQSAFIVVGACLLPIFLMNWHSGAFLIALGQDPDVSRLAGEFSRYTVFGTPFLFFYEMNRKVLQAQGILKPLVVIMGMGNVVNITLGYYLTYHTSLGFHGAALSRVLAYITLSALLVPYYYMNPSYMRWWPGWKIQQAWSYVGQFLHLGIPGMLMMAMEWWAYEILALMAGILPDAVIAVSAQAVIMTMCSMLYMLFLGVAVAGNIRVGQCLGANMPRKAKMISNLTMRVVFWMSCVIALIVLICRHQIPAIFISDPQSIERAASVCLIMVPYEIIDAVNCVIQGIYRGTGRQHVAAITNAVAYYGVGVPFAGLLAFKFGLGVEGLWIGFGSGIFTAFIVSVVYLYYSSWDQMAKEAQARASN